MTSALDLLPVIAPELAGAANMETFVELAAGRVGPKVFGPRYNEAVAYLAAHLMTISQRGLEAGVAAAGPVTSVRTGGLAVSFGQSGVAGAVADESLGSTAYGLEFLAIRASRVGTKGFLIR